MKAISGKQLCRLPESRGWVLKRIKGSYHIHVRAGSPLQVSVPVHGHRALKRGLQEEPDATAKEPFER